VAPGDAGALAAAMRQLLDNTLLAGRLGRAGALRAHAEYGQDGFVSRMKHVYLDALAGRRRRAVARRS
jgi:rhamnosyl/mannosyltransferase